MTTPREVGWYCYEEVGCEVKCYEDWAMSQGPAENNACYGKYKTILDCPSMVRMDDMHLGLEVLAPHLIAGWVKAVVTQVDLKNGVARAETEHSVFPFEFGRDHRQCWTCSAAINKKLLDKLVLKVTVP